MKNTTTLQSKRSITVLLGVLLYFSSLSAQTMQDTIIANFSLMERIPKEKLYLHLDKPFYGAGEKIWFKGYLVNAITHQDNAQSNFIITELINRSDSIVERKKIRRDSLGFHNAFTLPATLPAGDYYLRGYSNWMLNEDPDFFFSRNIKIGNSIDNTIVSSIEYQQEDDTHYTAKIKFTSNVQAVFENTTIKYLYLENGKIKNKGKKKTDENGNSLDRNFSTVMKMMRLAEISEQDENHRSPLDEMMDELRTENPHSMAVSFYADFKKAPAETAKSILISAAVRFAAFNLPEVADLTHTDNIHLDTLGDRKTALFIIIPSSDATFNFLAAMMYTQLFDTLYDTANFKYGGKLPVHVRCLLDEFANVGTIPDFDKLLATMRSMEISANIIIQNLAQLKKMYDKSWEILTGNCDSLLFLGGQEATTLEAISKSLGKETIDVVSQNRTRSHKSPSTSENNSILGRELMTTDELKVMKPNECVLIVRALYPFFCHKFDIEKHQNYKYLEDSNKNYAYLIDDLHTEKAPDITEIYSETVEPKTVAQPVDDEKDISDIDVPDEEDNMTNLDEEFDTKEIAAALKQHEEQTAGEEMFNENEELDFSDEAVPENIMPMDLSIPKVIGEADFNEIVDSTF